MKPCSKNMVRVRVIFGSPFYFIPVQWSTDWAIKPFIYFLFYCSVLYFRGVLLGKLFHSRWLHMRWLQPTRSAIYNLISWTRARSIVISMFNQTGLFMRSRSQSLWSIFCALLLTDWNKIRVNKWERKKRNGCVTKLVSVGHNNLPFIWPGKWLEELKDIFHRGKKFHSSNLSRFQWMSRKTTTSVGPVEKKC